jgi:hypothetical protein
MADVLGQHGLEHAVQSHDARARGVPCASPWFEQKQRLAVERASVEVVRVGFPHAAHGLGIRGVLHLARSRIEVGHVADRQRLDERPLARRGVLVLEGDGLLHRRVGKWRFARCHWPVQVRPP